MGKIYSYLISYTINEVQGEWSNKTCVLLAVDDDPYVLGSIKRDLEKQYNDRFGIEIANSGQSGLELVNRLKLSGGFVALFLVDYQMPHMTGFEFLERTIRIFPDAKRLLLTDYADTDAIMRSINKVKIDYYLT
jgi:thioredoxin reductase (NADPH)